jgi:hypothetical protein
LAYALSQGGQVPERVTKLLLSITDESYVRLALSVELLGDSGDAANLSHYAE